MSTTETNNSKDRSLLSAVILVVLARFTDMQLVEYIIPGIQQIMDLRPEPEASIYYTGLMWVPITAYILISGNIYLAVNIFKPLKSWRERGLVFSLFLGLTAGIAFGLVLGPFLGLVGLATDLGFIMGFWFGLTISLTSFLFCGLFLSTIYGLFVEFKK